MKDPVPARAAGRGRASATPNAAGVQKPMDA